MVSFTSALILFTTLATTAIPVSAHPNGALHELVARQTFDPSSVPQQCQDQCSALISSLTDATCGTDLSCVCGDNIAEQTIDCAKCDAQIIGEDEAKALYDKYAAACKSGGIDVPSYDSSSSSSSNSNSNSNSNSGSSNGGSEASGDDNSPNGASNLQMSAAGLAGTAALAFLLAA
ncbi:hypothetical protein AGABI1DRAFT_108500 [Agaricus bisporus var. burnettii JB137-S8]|uniref:Extracellular membrane protein CFEM domain-containing protein n=1 Tax=Agaricus bisporus var. burnettii (strain JB137-S8 / ATCC MYA-4627 / FGSC 10392) TaxID=597362 RepID=K5XQ32_AGABU|nr:uncharacterized protein AGABI1DRAFT_108500 [Agaricus bisporus var. burnettii JB137-S8]EKM76875.1 hypothetical protein AGABI1DRAFT_108500 [Agaricus bisporus var. burnettii JB137-S8]